MKKLIFIILSLISINVFSQNTIEKGLQKASQLGDSVTVGVKNTVNNIDTASLYKTIYNDAKEGLKGLAGALKVGVEHVYTVLVKQQIVQSITNCVLYLILGIILYLLTIQFKSNWFQDSYKSRNDEVPAVFFTIGYIVGVVGYIVLIGATLNTTITGFANPEFLVMQQIMQWVK